MPLVTAPSGIGRSTLILAELQAGGEATGDNLVVGDGTTVWGLAEPLRVEGGLGRSMPHGRREVVMSGRVEALTPDSLVLLERRPADQLSLVPCAPAAAGRFLATSTYMAGELRRYWPFAATLAAGTGLGPAHPPVTDVASGFAARLPSFSLSLEGRRGTPLSELLGSLEAVA